MVPLLGRRARDGSVGALRRARPDSTSSPATGASRGCASRSAGEADTPGSRTPARTRCGRPRGPSPRSRRSRWRLRDDRFDPSTPSLTVTSLRVEGEPSINTIPDAVWLSIDRRLLPGESPRRARCAQIESAMRDAVAAPSTWALTVNRVCPPYIAAPGDPLCRHSAADRPTGRAGGDPGHRPGGG